MPLPENVSTFCASCGLPMRTSRCDACGGNAQPLALEDGDSLASLAARGEASPLAREAWARRDWASFVSHALTVEQVSDVRTTRLSDGPGFVAVVGGCAVLIAVRQNAQQIVIEAPVARLPATLTVPAMRILLESSHDPAPGTRFAVRDDLVVARFVGRLDQEVPLAFGAALRALVATTTEMADRLVSSTDARMLPPSEHQGLDFDTMPASRFLGRIAHAQPAAAPAPSPGIARRPQVAPFRGGTPTAQALPSVGGGNPTAKPARPSGAFEALLAPGSPPSHLPTPRAPDPFSQAGEALGEIPAVLSPPPTEVSPGSPRASAAPPAALSEPPRAPPAIAKTMEVAAAPSLKPPPRAATGPSQESLRPTPLAVPAVSAPPLDRSPRPAPVAAPAPKADLTSTQISAAPPTTGPAALCELLQRAQTLGAVLALADQPASTLLLVRATVYRAVFEFADSCPGAVTELFDKTRELTREIHITAPGKRRGAMAIPAAEPAFEIFGEIAAAGGVRPGSGPPPIEPITTAQDAKQHLARYVSEIDQAPADLEIRHFLGLGALCELVARTKLPPQTLDRVRGIIGRAIKEGARQSSIELMMTALNRIIGG